MPKKPTKRIKKVVNKLNSKPIQSKLPKLNKPITTVKSKVSRTINTPKTAIKKKVKEQIKTVFKGQTNASYEKYIKELEKQNKELQGIINKLRERKIISPEQKLYNSVKSKVTRRLNKLDNYNNYVMDISESIGFDPYKLNNTLFGGVTNKFDFEKIKNDKTMSMFEKTRLFESQLLKLDEVFAENGRISFNNKKGLVVFSKKFQATILKSVSYISYFDSDTDYRVSDKEEGMERLSQLTDYFKLDKKQAYELWNDSMGLLSGKDKDQLAFTFEEFLEFIELI